ncbi:hypothetical protein HPB52_010235 [Rhipicephalus sanguineus]|uniref:CCHC-type domain-containing protein n=1 Tax=Rhipicephalus sanguineus TaxID=34632 RepID=A0A9D4YMX9_RHISA|nr:hypothetical protein HPB52_010235 [Rhipicephalus sanguineus]
MPVLIIKKAWVAFNVTVEGSSPCSGRPPLCLRCRGTGHIQRECRVLRCGLCHRFGHDETQCVHSYANVTGSGLSEAMEEHVIDEADVEPPATGGGDSAKTERKQQAESFCEGEEKKEGAAVPAANIKEAAEGDKAAEKKNIPEATNEACPGGTATDCTDMECEQITTPAVVKRPLEVDEGNGNRKLLPANHPRRRSSSDVQP